MSNVSASVRRSWIVTTTGSPVLTTFTISSTTMDNGGAISTQQASIQSAIVTALAGSPDGSAAPALNSTIAAIDAAVSAALSVPYASSSILEDDGVGGGTGYPDIFHAYNSADSAGFNAATTMPIDTEFFVSSPNYTLAASEITVSSPGLYIVEYQAHFRNLVNFNTLRVGTFVQRDPGGGGSFATIAGSLSAASMGGVAGNTARASCAVAVTAGDIFRLRASVDFGGATAATAIGQTLQFRISRIA